MTATTTKPVATFKKAFRFNDWAGIRAQRAALEATGEYVKVTVRRDAGYGPMCTVYGYQNVQVEEKVTGECQICGRQQCMTKDGALVSHGYQRPGWGHIVGNCYGAGHATYQKGTDALELVVAKCEDAVRYTKKIIGQKKAAKKLTFRWTDRRYIGAGKYETTAREWVADLNNWQAPPIGSGFYFDSFDHARMAQVVEAQRHYRDALESLQHFEKRLAASPAR